MKFEMILNAFYKRNGQIVPQTEKMTGTKAEVNKKIKEFMDNSEELLNIQVVIRKV